MAQTNKPQHDNPQQPDPRQTGTRPEDEPAVERGERIATGKDIARGGKKGGKVPGATPDREWQPGDSG